MNRTLRLRMACAVLALACLTPVQVRAEVPGVSALLQQGRYWQSKGRQDLASQAFRRALALDPNNAEARRGLAGPAPRAQANPAPATKPVPAQNQTARPATPADAKGKAGTGAGAARSAGFKALEANDLDGAERSFQRAVAANRRDAEALGGLGLVRLRQARFGEARDLLNQASRLGSASQWADALASARFFAGLADARTSLAEGRVDEAQTQTEALVRSGYSQPGPALELLAEIYEKQGRYADAADLYRQAGEGAKQSDGRLASRAARDRARAAAARGDDVTAEQEFHSGLLLDQRDPWIRYEFARYLMEKRRAPEAESLVSSLASSNDPDWLYAAALLNAQMGRSSQADALVARIPETQRTGQMRHFAVGLKIDGAIERAKALAAQGRQADALMALRQLGATPSIDATKQASVADALLELGDSESAAQLAQQALTSGTITDPQGYEPIVRVLAKAGRDAFAANAVQRASQLAGNSTDGQRVVARMNGIMAAAQADRLRQAGQYAQAFDQLQAAWNAAPGNQDVLAALARLYQSGGMPAQAAQTYQMVLAQSPEDKGALTGLIETAGAAGDRELARRTIDRALRIAPDDYEIYLAAARMEQARGDRSAALRYLKRAQEIYAAKTGVATLTPSNPFAATVQGNNPFRNLAPAAARPQPNPFALGPGARLAGAPAQPDTAFAPSQPIMDNGGFPPAMVAQSVPGTGGYDIPMSSQGGGAPMPTAPGALAGDPVMARIQSEIQTLTRESGPRAELHTGYRQRSGETGLSELKELTGAAEISTGLGNGRISAKAEAVVLDGGRPTGSALARFGTNATPEAEGIVAEQPSQLIQAKTQNASGVALSIAYETDLFQLELGRSPLGFEDSDVTWRAAISPRLSSSTSARAWFERKPVTDSVLSYAGTRDPVTGALWGQVMRTGGGASMSYDREGAGVYGDLSYYRYAGHNVRKNRGLQANIGGYLPFYRGDRSSITGGLNLNYQDFDNSQNYFTYGHGGYFSPQSFFSVSLPVRYSFKSDLLEVAAAVAPGYQSYSQDQTSLYPTEPAAQAALDALKALNSDVRSYYDSLSQTGFALSADGSIYYRISPGTRVGGEIGINTFGSYDEFKSLVGIRQSLGGNR